MLTRKTLRKKIRLRRKVVKETNEKFLEAFKQYLSQTFEDLIDSADPLTLIVRWTVSDLIQMREEVTRKTSIQYIGDVESYVADIKRLLKEYYSQELELYVSETSDEESYDEKYRIRTSIFKIVIDSDDSTFDSSEGSSEESDDIQNSGS